MSIEKTLSVAKRQNLGKGANRRLRSADIVPGVFYSASGEKNIPVQMEKLPLEKLISDVHTTAVFNLEIDDNGTKATYPALVWQYQKHPYKNAYTHVDFLGVDLDKDIKFKVPVEFVGTPKGVKLGGKFETYREVLVLKGKPLNMPQKVTVDVSDMNINTTISVADVVLPEGVTAVFDSNFAMVSVIAEDNGAAESAGA